jgi:hypothetical protein
VAKQDGASVGKEPRDVGVPDRSVAAPTLMGEADAGHRKARDFANTFVDALLAERYGEVYRKTDESFRTAVPEDQLRPMLEQMYDAYGGKPLEAELTTEESGCRMFSGAPKHVHKFWYALRSTRCEKDAFALFVELQPDDDNFVCSTFFVIPSEKSPGR